MNRGLKYTLGGLVIAAALGASYVMKFGLYPRYFDIEWEEEVKLHDGRMILVHIKRTYERTGLRLERFPKHPRQISMGFNFETEPHKTFQHTFIRGTLHFLDKQGSKWYVGYHADPGDPSVEIGSRLLYPHVAILNADGSIEKPKSWADVPAEISNANILPATPNPQAISRFNGKRLTSTEKLNYWSAYPTGAGWGTIQRITPQPINQGEMK